MVYTESMTVEEITHLLASNERAILDAHSKANVLAVENQLLRKALNKRTVIQGFSVGSIVCVVASNQRTR